MKTTEKENKAKSKRASRFRKGVCQVEQSEFYQQKYRKNNGKIRMRGSKEIGRCHINTIVLEIF
jgi:hypothetical protein